MTSFLLQNKYISTSVQRAGIPRFPGCLEHAQMIWNSWMTAKYAKKKLHNLWLDLANAYGSVPLNCIQFALKFFHIPEKVADILMQYFGNVFTRFTTNDYTKHRQALEVGIMMGCVVSPLLFPMCMELILRGTNNTSRGEETRSGGVLPPSMAFMDDVTTLTQSKVSIQELQDRFHDLFTWAWMKAKPKKSQSIFPCPWDYLWYPFLHRWQHYPHSPGTAIEEARQVICLPTHRQTKRSWGTEDCPGGPSRHWEEWDSWKAQGMVLPAWSLTPPPVAPADLHINKYPRNWLGVPPPTTPTPLERELYRGIQDWKS